MSAVTSGEMILEAASAIESPSGEWSTLARKHLDLLTKPLGSLGRLEDLAAQLAHELIQVGGAQAILLAGTDLSSFYADQPPSYAYVDAARLHIDEIVRSAHEPSASGEPSFLPAELS